MDEDYDSYGFESLNADIGLQELELLPPMADPPELQEHSTYTLNEDQNISSQTAGQLIYNYGIPMQESAPRFQDPNVSYYGTGATAQGGDDDTLRGDGLQMHPHLDQSLLVETPSESHYVASTSASSQVFHQPLQPYGHQIPQDLGTCSGYSVSSSSSYKEGVYPLLAQVSGLSIQYSDVESLSSQVPEITTDSSFSSAQGESSHYIAENSQLLHPVIGYKLKMYEWPPQSDPLLEAKRLRAIKQHNKRQMDQSRETGCVQKLKHLGQEVEGLQLEKHQVSQRVKDLEEQLEALGIEYTAEDEDQQLKRKSTKE